VVLVEGTSRASFEVAEPLVRAMLPRRADGLRMRPGPLSIWLSASTGSTIVPRANVSLREKTFGPGTLETDVGLYIVLSRQ
jgi:hypothetical protein